MASNRAQGPTTLTAKPSQPSVRPPARRCAPTCWRSSRGLFRSRNRAQAEIRAGNIFSGDRKVESASDMLDAGVKLTLNRAHRSYVSRGALKLVHALDHFGVDPASKVMPRCRRIDRRIHAGAPPARREEGVCGGCRRRAAAAEVKRDERVVSLRRPMRAI